MFTHTNGKPFTNREINQVYECYEDFLNRWSIKKFMVYKEMLPKSMYAIKNRDIKVPYSLAHEVFVIQYSYKTDKAKKAAAINSKLSCPFIDDNDFKVLADQYSNNYGWDLTDKFFLSGDFKDPDKMAVWLEKHDKEDKTPIKKHEPLDENEPEPKDEPKEDKPEDQEAKTKGKPRDEVEASEPVKEFRSKLTECYKKFLEDTSIFKYLIKHEEIPLKGEPIKNKNIYVADATAFDVFRMQYCDRDREAAEDCGIKHGLIIKEHIPQDELLFISHKYPNNFEYTRFWDGLFDKYEGRDDKLAQYIIKHSLKDDDKAKEETISNTKMEVPLYKSIDLEPFRKMKVSEAHKAYAKALGIRPISISIKLFERLMKGEDVDPIRHQVPAKPDPKTKPDLSLSDPTPIFTSDSNNKRKLSLSTTSFAKTPEEITNLKLSSSTSTNIPTSKPSLKLSSSSTTNIPTKKSDHSRDYKQWAAGVLEGVEADGRISKPEAPLYQDALDYLDKKNLSKIPTLDKVRAGTNLRKELPNSVIKRRNIVPWK